MNTNDKPLFPNPTKWYLVEEEGAYNLEDVQEWFQRCMKDAPEPIQYDWEDREVGLEVLRDDYVKWFEKWFSQFRENT